MSIEKEDKLEKELQDKGLNAPRLSPSDIDDSIKYTTFTVMPSNKCMVCELTLRNGFTVRGESAVVSPENFDRDIGMRLSLSKARDKVWGLLAYALQEKHPIADPWEGTLLPWQFRVTVEKSELDKKIAKLQKFIDFTDMTASEYDLLCSQLSNMRAYSADLETRIDNFNK